MDDLLALEISSSSMTVYPWRNLCGMLCRRPQSRVKVNRSQSLVFAPLPFKIPGTLAVVMRHVQSIQNATTLRSLSSKCMTAELTAEHATAMFPSGYSLVPSTLGGMGRVYVAMRDGKEFSAKITDNTRKFGQFEQRGYAVLESHAIPAARIEWRGTTGRYSAVIMEKLWCTATTFLASISYTSSYSHLLKPFVQNLEYLLNTLKIHGIAFVDLTPDNIMCRLSGDNTVDLVLIDPQFLVKITDLAGVVGITLAEDVDRMHLCLKFLSLSYLRHGGVLGKHCEYVAKALIGYVPSKDDVTACIAKTIPRVIHAANDILSRN